MTMLSPGVQPLTKTQDQLAQLEIKFKGPLVKDSVVELYADLLKLPNKYHYEHKMIWVKEHKSYYYLDNGDGTAEGNWQKQVSRVVIQQYVDNQTYQKDDTVFLSGKIYKAKQNIPVGYSPLNYPGYWITIAGDTETVRYIFKNAASVIIYTEIRNPQFEAILGEFEYENDQLKIGEDGLAIIHNQEIVSPHVRRREDLTPNDGLAYEISFFENGEPAILSGAINIK